MNLKAMSTFLRNLFSSRRERLTAAALAGLLADHKDHEDERKPGESCPAAVARLAVEMADEAIKRLERKL